MVNIVQALFFGAEEEDWVILRSRSNDKPGNQNARDSYQEHT